MNRGREVSNLVGPLGGKKKEKGKSRRASPQASIRSPFSLNLARILLRSYACYAAMGDLGPQQVKEEC
jgi:hypothetical protein